MRTRIRDFASILLLWLFALPAWAQTNYNTSPQAQTGTQTYGSYFSTDIDSIGLYNGNLHLSIPLFSLPGRELPYGLTLTYNSQKWEEDDCDGWPCGRYTGGWQKANLFGAAVPSFWVQCGWQNGAYTWTYNVFWIDGGGAKHRYKQEQAGSCYGGASWDNRTLSSLDSDGSTFFTGTYMTSSTTAASITFKDGNVLYFRGNATSPSYDYATPNGNYLTKSTNMSVVGVALPTQDTLGRTASYSTSGSYWFWSDVYGVTDSNGVSRSYTLNWERIGNGTHWVWDPWWGGSANWITVIRLNSIDLPNGKSYTFEYDHPQAFMTKVTLPSGGYIKYAYPTSTGNFAETIQFLPENDQVIERRVSADGTSGSEKVWTYSGYTGLGSTASSRTVTVTNPESDKVVHTFNAQGEETTTEWKTSSNVVLKSATSSWSHDAVESNGQPNTPRVNTASSYLNGELQSTTTVTYDSLMNVTQTKVTRFADVISQKDITYTTISGNYKRPSLETVSAADPSTGTFGVQGKTEYVYDEYSLTARSSVPNHTGNTSASGRGNLTTVKRYKDASNYIAEHLKYDSVGNVVEMIDGLNHSTTIDFTDNFTDSTNRDTFAYPKKVTNALSQYATSKYDYSTGLVMEVTNVRGYTTTTAYDLMNRVTTVTEPAVGGTSKVTTYAYDDTNRKTTKEVTVDTSGNKGHVETFFDKLYRTVKTVTNDPEGAISSEIEYDGIGRVKKTSNPYRSGDTVVWTQTAYDGLSRPATVTAPDSSTVQYAYANNVTTTADQAGNQRRYTYNALGQLTMVEEPSPTLATPAVTTYKYYGFGPLYQSTQSTQTRTWVYNWLGQMTSQTLPESGTTSFTYDGAGRLDTKTDARSVVTTMAYDNANRVTQRSYSDSTPTVGFTYDQSSQTGLRTAMSDGLGSVAYTYDTMNRLTSEARTLTGISGTFSTSYVYNVKGDVTQMTYPSGRVVNFAYATGGGCCNSRLSSVADGTTTTTLLNSIAFNAAGGVTSQTLNPGSNAISEAFTYNNRLQLTQIQATKSSTTVMDFSYNYGSSSTNTGRVLSRTDALQPEHSATYVYDSLYRLAQAVGADSSWSVSWALDTWGNRTSQTPSGLATSKVGSQTLGYSSNKNTSFTYDSAGNTTNDTVHTYAYNAENQQISMDSTAATYAYDGEGRRMKKATSSETTYSFYGPGGILCEFSTTNTGATAASSSDKTIYRTSEKTGTAVLLFNTAGMVIENNRTLPYGEAWLADVASANDKKFTTYDRDKESGLDYAMARMYASTMGRMTSPDNGRITSFVPTTLNRYTYGNIDPINFTDRDGNQAEPTKKIEVDVVGSYFPTPLPGSGPSGGGGRDDQTTLGGSVAEPPVAAAPPPPPPAPPKSFCDKQDPTNAKVLNFIQTFSFDAQILGNATGLPADVIMAWAGYESNYGTSPTAKNNNNFFGLMSSDWPGAVPCDGVNFAVQGAACFITFHFDGSPSLFNSGWSSLHTRRDYLSAGLQALSEGGGLKEIVAAIAKRGFNSEYGKDGTGYAKNVEDAADAIARRRECK